MMFARDAARALKPTEYELLCGLGFTTSAFIDLQ
jgi:hypothetical protein